MNIPPLSAVPSPSGNPAINDIVTLQERVARSDTERRPDPDYDAFYQALVGREDFDQVLSFIKAYENSRGERPYKSNAEQMKVLQQVLAQMKDQGLEKSELYEQTYKAFTTAFGVQAFITQFTQEVFDPQAVDKLDEESGW